MCVRSLPEKHKNDWLVTHLILLSNISALVVTSLGQTPCRRMAAVTVVFGDFLIDRTGNQEKNAVFLFF